METHLWRRTRRSRLKAVRKGFSSIVGAIFMTVIVWILASSYFVWTLSQNTVYNEAIRERSQLESDTQSENVQVTNTTYNVDISDKVSVSAIIRNKGSLGVQFLTLWVHASNENYDGYNFTQLSNVNLQGGANLTLSANIAVQGLSPLAVYNFAAWLITARGNVVPLQESTSLNIMVSQTTQGIGALMMNFADFFYYKVYLKQGSYYLNLSSQSSGYLVSKSDAPIAFMVQLTNLDPDDIMLNRYSEFFSILPFTGGAYQAVTWYIVNVDPATGLITLPFTNVPLPHPTSGSSHPTRVYFASMSPVQSSFEPLPENRMEKGTTPVNLALVGTKGGSPFGQNIPFVSIYVS